MRDIQCYLWLNHLKAVDTMIPYLPTISVLKRILRLALGERSRESHGASLSTFLSPSDFFFSKSVSGESWSFTFDHQPLSTCGQDGTTESQSKPSTLRDPWCITPWSNTLCQHLFLFTFPALHLLLSFLADQSSNVTRSSKPKVLVGQAHLVQSVPKSQPLLYHQIKGKATEAQGVKWLPRAQWGKAEEPVPALPLFLIQDAFWSWEDLDSGGSASTIFRTKSQFTDADKLRAGRMDIFQHTSQISQLCKQMSDLGFIILERLYGGEVGSRHDG